jgi:hypothetical protein
MAVWEPAFAPRPRSQRQRNCERTGVSDSGKVQGKFRSADVVPKVMERLRVSGIDVPASIFEETLAVP